MKVLYIANYRDGTGWANAALHNIMALQDAGVDVVPRGITFNQKNENVSAAINLLEHQPSSGADVCIQHTLPSLYVYNGLVKNIAMYETETCSFDDTCWPLYINMMDEAWVPNSQMIESSVASGVNIPTNIAPHCIDISEYVNLTPSASVTELQSTFNFGFVGDFIHRKNIEGLLRAFHTEFHPSEPVNLFLKLNKHGHSADECLNVFQNLSKLVKHNLKIRSSYQEEVVLTGFLDKQHLLSVMSQCHCFVMPSFGEAWCIPALESMALGIPVIYTKGTGMEYFCEGFGVPAHRTPCFRGTESLSDIYTSNTEWMEIDIRKLQHYMRTIYEMHTHNRKEYDELSEKCVARACEYDIKPVGQKLKELLYDTGTR